MTLHAARTATRFLTAVVASAAALAALLVPATSAAAAPAATVVQTATVSPWAGCPTSAPAGSLRSGSDAIGVATLCAKAVAAAPTPQAKLAIQAIFHMLGAPYACGGIGRMAPFRFDCSSLVSRAYFLGAKLDTAGPDWAPSTRDMVPWDGVRLAKWAALVAPASLRPGDLVLYDTGGTSYRHVAMYIGSGYMLHTSSCGDVAHVTAFWGFPTSGTHKFLVARRVVAPAGWTPPVTTPAPTPTTPTVPAPDPNAIPVFPGHSLVVGSTGAAVTAVQRALQRGGYLRPAQFGAIVLGTYGTQTRDAVAAYQYANPKVGGTPGVVTATVYRALTGVGTITTTVAEPPKPTVSVSRLLSGRAADIRVVQAALNRIVGAQLVVNGKWTTRTTAAMTVYRRQILGMTGSSALGAPGTRSLTALGRMTGFRVIA